MTELFADISDSIKAEVARVWDSAIELPPIEASEFLNDYTNLFEENHTEEETDFVRFYFNLQMEAMKE